MAKRGPDPVPGVNINARILLVADHPASLYLIGRFLAQQGFWLLEVANDGATALASFSREKYDLVLMVGDMDVLNGYDTALHMRGLEEGKRHTPIIGITPHAASGDREKCLKAGMDDYVAKPVETPRFLRMLARWVPGDTSVNFNADLGEDGRTLFTLRTGAGNAALLGLEDDGQGETKPVVDKDDDKIH